MKVLGIIFISIAGALIGLSITTLIQSIQGLISINWSFATDADKALWWTFITTGVVELSFIATLIGTFAAKHHWAFIIIASILAITPAVIMLVMEIKAGTITGFTWPLVQKYGTSFAVPVLYIIGSACYLAGCKN